MSRTYRRKKDRKNRNCEVGMWGSNFEESHHRWWIHYKYDGNFKKAKALYHADNPPGYYSPPSWFFKECCTKPERCKTRDLIHKVKTLIDYEDSPVFPHHKKPKEYYW